MTESIDHIDQRGNRLSFSLINHVTTAHRHLWRVSDNRRWLLWYLPYTACRKDLVLLTFSPTQHGGHQTAVRSSAAVFQHLGHYTASIMCVCLSSIPNTGLHFKAGLTNGPHTGHKYCHLSAIESDFVRWEQ